MAVKDFALPDLGEGLTESELVSWKVAVGDSVHLNQIIAEVETAKALVELPAPYDGRVSRLYVEPGVTVAVGEPLVAFEVAGAEPESADGPDGAGDRADVPEPTLVGYGARPDATTRPARRARPGLAPAGQAREAAPARETAAAVAPAPAAAQAATATALAERPRATPPVRKLARERGIDLGTVTGTGAGGPATAGGSHRLPVSAAPTAPATPSAPATADRGDVRIPIRGVRKATAEAMVRSAFSAPQATVFLTVDVTATSELVERLRARTAEGEARPGLLAVVAKALCLAIRRTPEVNARWDDDAQEIVQSGAVHLGIAAATPRGLLVPVVRDADLLPLTDLAGAIRTLAETARSGRTAPADLSGSTITITNVGVFGVDAGTPIVTPGEAAILALGAVRRQPWEHDGGIALRDVLTLALSFDHRIVDGQQASILLADLGRILNDPASVLAFV
ncbi:dihydrolipoamide acetyltransferase family protein [Leifsonia sp. 71-9]|uniref:dihydrolipoamide acetyltransferase family protein n=1 Tax=Leifsonia sp. 71-9 TaxID=1895934 RepID=UPI0009268FB6|nr:dihydrolipoamide acetyltransferase family protein [Leifsonia sp. 71-9]OJX74955.1 MAG: branched-chain alpha-keto acid dehydrogenase subunit E2 [Leifsonia sp. 71-9]